MVFLLLGRYDLYKFSCKCYECGSTFDPFNIGTLISTGYWPSSFKSSSYLFDENVFLTWDVFRKRMPGTSEKSFLDSLNDLTVHYGRVSIEYLEINGTEKSAQKYRKVPS